jgi:glutaredoxin 3
VPLVEIYTKTTCPYCWRAKHLLNAKGIEYHEVVVDFAGPEKQMMIQRANGRTTVPQIFIGELHVGGCDELFALEHRGKLDALFVV